MNKKIVTFGELLLRLSAPGYNKLFQTDQLITSFCGAEANVAVSLANFGLHSAFVTRLCRIMMLAMMLFVPFVTSTSM